MSEYNGVLYGADPPAGIERNPDQSPDAAVLTVVTGIVFPLAAISMFIRMYARVVIIKKVALDDYLMILAFICNILMVAFVLDMLRFGLGKHLWNVRIDELYPYFNAKNLLAAIFFCAATGLAKGSILLFYLRIFPSKTVVYTVWGVFTFTIAYSLACVFVNIFSCNPVKASWDLVASETGVCINRPAFYFAQAALGIATDIATVVTPMPFLRQLQLRTRRKVGVAVVLTLGGFVCVVSIIRLQSLYVLLTNLDLTTNTVTALMWCVLELNLSIIGGSMPAMKPVLQKYFPRLLASTQGHTDSNAYYLEDSNSKSKRSRNDPYSVSQIGGQDSDNESDKRSIVHQGDRQSVGYHASGKSDVEIGVMGASLTKGPDAITKTVEYGYEVTGDDNPNNLSAVRIDEEAQNVRGTSPPRI